MGQITKKPKTTEYILPRMRVAVSELNDDGSHKGQPWTYVGNAPTVTLAMDTEELEHYLSTSSVSIRDIFETTQVAINGSLTIESMSQDNLSLFFAAEEDDDFVNPTITGITDETVVTDGLMVVDTWFGIEDEDGDSATGITSSNLVLSSTNATPVTLTETTDYVLDTATGQVYFVDGSTAVETIITNAEGVTATLTADEDASGAVKLAAGSSGSTTLAVRLEQLSAINTDEDEVIIVYTMHKVKVAPDGDMNMVSDELQNVPLKLALELSDSYDNVMDILDLRDD